MATRTTQRRQLRGFVVVWMVITFMMGLATFLAIYFTYGGTLDPSTAPLAQNVDVSGSDGGTVPVVVLASPSPQPTIAPTITPTDATTAVVQAAPTTEPTTPTPTEVPPTPLPIDNTAFQVGIQVQEVPDFNREQQDGYNRSVAEDLGLRWIKQQVRWEILEPVQGEINWTMLDTVIPSASSFGLNVMISVVTAPEWAREPGVNTAQHGPPADPQDFADFVGAILRRYPGQIHAVEVWNEQNLDREWTSVNGVRASDYVNLLRVTHDTIRAIDPGIIIISGALSPTGFFGGCTQQGCDDQPYMEAMLTAGVLNYSDCIGAHHNGYNVGPNVPFDAVPNDPSAQFRGPFDSPHPSWTFRSTLQGYASRIASAGGNTPLCVTEFGWASAEGLDGVPAGFEFAADNTLDEQAEWIPEALDVMEDWGNVWLAFIWNFNYGPQAGWDPLNDNVPYSIIGPDFVFRPAYNAIREWQQDYLERTES